MNNILLVFDEKFEVDKSNLCDFLNTHTTYLNFEIGKNIKLNSFVVTKPDSFDFVSERIKEERKEFDIIFYFTEVQYDDNYFFHEKNGIIIISFWEWSYLTNLPKSNGILYFIIDYLSLSLDETAFRHRTVTGCIYDFLKNKTGVDDGMRQARICPNCLKRITNNLHSDSQIKILNDLKELMNLLSNASKWNQDILQNTKPQSIQVQKRQSKEKDAINIVIASPTDTQIERTYLLDKLETQFRRGNHETHCAKRLIVHGWEDLASQVGYPQDIINSQIIQQVDFVVAVFKHKLGTPTIDTNTGKKRTESGTVEELLSTLDNSKIDKPLGMAYFYSKAPNPSLDSPDFNAIKEDWDKLEAFKNDIKTKMIYKPYTESSDLLQTIIEDLEKNIKNNFK
jgi:hypothetical protein